MNDTLDPRKNPFIKIEAVSDPPADETPTDFRADGRWMTVSKIMDRTKHLDNFALDIEGTTSRLCRDRGGPVYIETEGGDTFPAEEADPKTLANAEATVERLINER